MTIEKLNEWIKMLDLKPSNRERIRVGDYIVNNTYNFADKYEIYTVIKTADYISEKSNKFDKFHLINISKGEYIVSASEMATIRNFVDYIVKRYEVFEKNEMTKERIIDLWEEEVDYSRVEKQKLKEFFDKIMAIAEEYNLKPNNFVDHTKEVLQYAEQQKEIDNAIEKVFQKLKH